MWLLASSIVTATLAVFRISSLLSPQSKFPCCAFVGSISLGIRSWDRVHTQCSNVVSVIAAFNACSSVGGRKAVLGSLACFVRSFVRVKRTCAIPFASIPHHTLLRQLCLKEAAAAAAQVKAGNQTKPPMLLLLRGL